MHRPARRITGASQLYWRVQRRCAVCQRYADLRRDTGFSVSSRHSRAATVERCAGLRLAGPCCPSGNSPGTGVASKARAAGGGCREPGKSGAATVAGIRRHPRPGLDRHYRGRTDRLAWPAYYLLQCRLHSSYRLFGRRGDRSDAAFASGGKDRSGIAREVAPRALRVGADRNRDDQLPKGRCRILGGTQHRSGRQ